MSKQFVKSVTRLRRDQQNVKRPRTHAYGLPGSRAKPCGRSGGLASGYGVLGVRSLEVKDRLWCLVIRLWTVLPFGLLCRGRKVLHTTSWGLFVLQLFAVYDVSLWVYLWKSNTCRIAMYFNVKFQCEFQFQCLAVRLFWWHRFCVTLM